jgi:hypothetical protein
MPCNQFIFNKEAVLKIIEVAQYLLHISTIHAPR